LLINPSAFKKDSQLMRNLLLYGTSVISLVATAIPASAATKIVNIDDLLITNGKLVLPVPAGDGIVIDLSEVGQVVQGARFGDATKFVISGVNGQLCYMQTKECESTGASVIAFSQVKGIQLPTQTHTADGSTTVTLTTTGKLGDKLLHIRLMPTARATYTALVVKNNQPLKPATLITQTSSKTQLVSSTVTSPPPMVSVNKSIPLPIEIPVVMVEIEKTLPPSSPIEQKPVLPLKGATSLFQVAPLPMARTVESIKPEGNSATISPKAIVTKPLIIASPIPRSDANALAEGLRRANPKQGNILKIDRYPIFYARVQNAIIVLRHGGTREEAAKAARLDQNLIVQLINLGQPRRVG
jgi:hypothetical protein